MTPQSPVPCSYPRQSRKMPERAYQSLAGEVALTHDSDPLAHEGDLYDKLDEGKARCWACAHRCIIRPGGRGICRVRFNQNGRLYVPWGYVAALQSDPIEKKPFYHIYPGSKTLTFGMLGCDLHCPYCQNWNISQALRDSEAGATPFEIRAEEIVDKAVRDGAICVASSYNEPLITSEWAMSIFRLSKAAGLTNLFISNGNATGEVLEYIRPYTDGYKIDLKSMRDRNYRKLGATLNHILDGIRMVHEMAFWLEIVTLVIPGFNDSDEELRDAAQFIHSLSPDIPWHVTAFHPDYHMLNVQNTDVVKLLRAAEIGYHEGLHYVYAGNLPGQVGSSEDTRCPTCQQKLIRRSGYSILDYCLTSDGTCPNCKTRIPGIWQQDAHRSLPQGGRNCL